MAMQTSSTIHSSQTTAPQRLPELLEMTRRRVRRALWIYGLSWVIAVVLALTWCAGLADWLFHLDDAGIRVILALAILAVGSAVAWRFLATPLWHPLSDSDLALRIERRYPSLQGRFASTLQFTQQNADAQLGSPALQKHVIHETLQNIEDFDVTDIVERHPILRVAGVALGVFLIVGTTVGFHHAEAATALDRLLFPFAAGAWPRQTELRLLDANLAPLSEQPGAPLRLARGQTLEVYVENANGNLPDDIVMEYRVAGRHRIAEPLRRTTRRDAAGNSRDVCAADLIGTKGPMRFRAVGGDHRDMPWRHVELVPPPTVETLRVTLLPPPYTGRPAQELPSGVGQVRGLVGTTVTLQATANKALVSATLRVDDVEPARVPDRLEDRTLTASFPIPRAGTYSYSLTLQDQHGFINTDAPDYEVHGVADSVPEVYFDRPPRDVQVTVNAVIPLRILAKDDLGLNEIRLHRQWDNASETTETGGQEAVQAAETADVLRVCHDRPEQLTIEHACDLSEWNVSPGMRLVLHAEATDHYDLGQPHVGRSVTRVLTIVSPQTKAEELAARQAELLDELDRVVTTQRLACEQVGELRRQLKTMGQLLLQDADRLKRVELDQRQIALRLLGPADGVQTCVSELLTDLAINKIADPETQGRLTRLADELSVLRDTYLPAIERELTRAREGTQWSGIESLTSSHQHAETFERISENQSAVLGSLKQMRQSLAQWRDRRSLTSDVEELVANQEALNQATGETAKRTLNKVVSDLTRPEQTELTELDDRQQQLAHDTDQLRVRLSESAQGMIEHYGDANSASDARRRSGYGRQTGHAGMSQALDHLVRSAIAERMREIGDQLGKNQIGRAATTQQQVLAQLNELASLLRGREGTDTDDLVRGLVDAEDRLKNLRQRQLGLLRQSQLAASEKKTALPTKQLATQQQQLRQDVTSITHILRRLYAHRAAHATHDAAEGMHRAETQLQAGAIDRVPENQQEAVDHIEKAQKDLARVRGVAQERLTQQVVHHLGDKLEVLIGQQQAIIDEVTRVAEEHGRRVAAENRPLDNWKRGETRTLRLLGTSQEELKEETGRLVELPRMDDVLVVSLQNAMQAMQTTATRLLAKQIDDETFDAAKTAKRRLVDVLAALSGDNGTHGAGHDAQHAQTPDDQPNSSAQPGPSLPPDKALAGDGTAPAGRPVTGQPGDRLDPEAENLLEIARRRSFIDQTWGHLPASLRERILEASNQRPLPKYQEHVQRYFEALAEPNRQKER